MDLVSNLIHLCWKLINMFKIIKRLSLIWFTSNFTYLFPINMWLFFQRKCRTDLALQHFRAQRTFSHFKRTPIISWHSYLFFIFYCSKRCSQFQVRSMSITLHWTFRLHRHDIITDCSYFLSVPISEITTLTRSILQYLTKKKIMQSTHNNQHKLPIRLITAISPGVFRSHLASGYLANK